jgi:hypothetical protein
MPGAVGPAGDRVPWVGTYRFMAVYGRELTPAEIQQNFTAGMPRVTSAK